jgi:hypothetical protein
MAIFQVILGFVIVPFMMLDLMSVAQLISQNIASSISFSSSAGLSECFTISSKKNM